MKRCPSCNRTIDDNSQSFCPTDGARLVDAASPPASDDYLQATIMATPSIRPSSELPPPDAYSTNAGGSGQFNQPPQPSPNPEWAQNQSQTSNAQWSNQQGTPFTPPQNPTWQAPAAAAPAKRGMNPKLAVGAFIGCGGLLAAAVIGVAVFVFLISGPSSKMNPYTGSLRDLVPSSISNWKQLGIEPMKETDKKDFGNFKDGIGVTYEGGAERQKAMVAIVNYDSAKAAQEGLKKFKSKVIGEGWTITAEESKKIGWSTVGLRFTATKSVSRMKENSLQEGARVVETQAASPSPSSKKMSPALFCWTNGSVLYAVIGHYWDARMLESPFDSPEKVH